MWALARISCASPTAKSVIPRPPGVCDSTLISYVDVGMYTTTSCEIGNLPNKFSPKIGHGQKSFKSLSYRSNRDNHFNKQKCMISPRPKHARGTEPTRLLPHRIPCPRRYQRQPK